MTIYTIGFGGKSAEVFFETLRRSGARWLLDVRLKNTSQLAGFTKRDDLRYFLEQIAGIGYVELKTFAPTDAMLKAYRADGDWDAYEVAYRALLAERQPAREVERRWLDEGAVLLCSEPTAEHCHRRLAADHIRTELYPAAEIAHL